MMLLAQFVDGKADSKETRLHRALFTDTLDLYGELENALRKREAGPAGKLKFQHRNADLSLFARPWQKKASEDLQAGRQHVHKGIIRRLTEMCKQLEGNEGWDITGSGDGGREGEAGCEQSSR